MNLPVGSHTNALRAAVAATCSTEQGKFWEMHDHMQANPGQLDSVSLAAYARGIGMDEAAFRRCLAEPERAERITKGAEDARRKGAVGTPTFVVGRIVGRAVQGDVLIGAVPLGEIEKILNGLWNSDKPAVGGSKSAAAGEQMK